MDETAQRVWDRMRQVYAGFLAGDPAAVDRLLDRDVTLWDSEEPQLVRGLGELAELRGRRPAGDDGPAGEAGSGGANLEVPRVVDLQASDPVVDVWGDTALLRHRLRVVFSGGRPDQWIRNTSVWRRVDGEWFAVHNHEDVLAAP
ncbi:nuclear transport factor 2 family protein [Nakamurella endophytica]|uniref:Uncharacterized protein n=1 Tax=Nakamurella endophytica TaxID=1748367 RepID=A0A917WLK6_9ACTN|nr:nuclear transport factor 2 family protein [Nakamurella endophytica]GGM13944.1 hypothetical protein GCM10011594_37250 [Nakamurella endophytica]